MKPKSPIVIGGLGGSGTRVVAALLRANGIFMGDILNQANDNLLFSRLFKRPQWLASASPENIRQHLHTFEKYMTGQAWNVKDCYTYWQSTRKQVAPKKYKTQKVYQLLFQQYFKTPQNPPAIWGWKEPNTHIFLPQLIDYFEGLKYIYVVRHGLDMAFSQNQQQMTNWADQFKLPLAKVDRPAPLVQFDFWVAANERILKLGKEKLKDDFYFLNYDQLCLQPAQEIEKLFQFLGLAIAEDQRSALLSIPQKSDSMGRYLEQDCSIFSVEQLKKLNQFGFAIEASSAQHSSDY